MFGQVAAVYAFLRFSRALSAIASKLFDLVVVEFFDDFTQVEASETSTSAQEALEGLLTLLGWEIAVVADKRKPFQAVFTSLGVQVDYTGILDGDIHLVNKVGRVEGIRAQVQAIVDRNILTFKDALSIRGRSAFAAGATFGRLTAPIPGFCLYGPPASRRGLPRPKSLRACASEWFICRQPDQDALALVVRSSRASCLLMELVSLMAHL